MTINKKPVKIQFTEDNVLLYHTDRNGQKVVGEIWSESSKRSNLGRISIDFEGTETLKFYEDTLYSALYGEIDTKSIEVDIPSKVYKLKREESKYGETLQIRVYESTKDLCLINITETHTDFIADRDAYNLEYEKAVLESRRESEEKAFRAENRKEEVRIKNAESVESAIGRITDKNVSHVKSRLAYYNGKSLYCLRDSLRESIDQENLPADKPKAYWLSMLKAKILEIEGTAHLKTHQESRPKNSDVQYASFMPKQQI